MTALGRLAGWCYDHRRRVLLGWVVLLALSIGIGSATGSHFRDTYSAGNTPSAKALAILQSRFAAQAGDTAQVVFQTAAPVRSDSNKAAITSLDARLAKLPQVTSVVTPFAGAAGSQISRQGHIAFATVQFDAVTDKLPKSVINQVVAAAEAARHDGFNVQLGGTPIRAVATAVPGSSEGIGITAAMLIMLVAFGSVVAMGLPILTALMGLAVGVGVLELVTHLLIVPTFSPEMAAMIGLGVGIDYTLFIVTRYRQSMAAGMQPRDAVVASLSTAGRAVLFAGSTVVISLLGLFLIGQAYMIGISVACVVTVLLVMAGSLTLLPAVLGYAGRAIDRLRVPIIGGRPPTEKGFWWRWSRTVQRRAPWMAIGAVAVLVVLAIPLFSMRLAFTDASNDPASLTTRQAYDLLAQGFGPGFNGPLVVVAAMSGPSSVPVVDQLAKEVAAAPDVAAVLPTRFNAKDTGAVITVLPGTAPESATTATLVHHLRDQVVPSVTGGTGVQAEVGGETAAGIDAAAFLGGRTPLVIGAVIVLAFLLLMAVFRSVLVPLKAAIVNLLSIGAAYGVMVAVFQWGWAGSVIGIGKTGPIDPWIPLVMFTILFGLSMDYEVFLLSRIREEWQRTGDTSSAVADGLAKTARVITAAAAIMICVFASFVINDPLHILNVFGFGLAVAVFVDATLVRMILVPAVMELLGPANWWMPRWLDRAVPTLGLEARAGQAHGGPEPVSATA